MRTNQERRGVVIVLSAILMVVMFAMAALAIDMGYMFVVRTQLQSAADSAALAAGNSMHLTAAEIRQVATDFATRHDAGGRRIADREVLVELGIWDADAESFRSLGNSRVGNAVRVTTSRSDEGLFFARVMGTNTFATEASAIAMANPKDIVFVIDTSGSMNDDTEPAWATSTINSAFSGGGFGAIGNELIGDVYSDLHFGSFPGTLQYLGAPLGVAEGQMAYADMTSDIGPLANSGVPRRYRILAGDSEETRRQKAYSWIINNQLAAVIPAARPRPSQANYAYWEKYIDYVLEGSYVVSPSPPPPPSPPTPPSGGGGGGGVTTPPTPPGPPPPRRLRSGICRRTGSTPA